jgi:hypothetical protein
MRLEPIIGILLAAVAGWAAARLVRRFWPKSGKWGINPQPVACPTCGTPAPRFRKPANRRQMLWGGWTCPCGTECDKSGHPIPPP